MKKLQTMFAADISGTSVELDLRQPNFARANVIIPLGDDLAKNDPSLPSTRDGTGNGQDQGHALWLAAAASTWVLHYNSDLSKKLG